MSVFTARNLLSVVLLGSVLSPPAVAFNFGNMMNPGEWFGGNRDRDDYYDDYYAPPGGAYGYPGAYPGYSYDGLGGYAAPGYGYGTPGYAAPGYAAPGYAAPGYAAPGYAAPGYAAPGYAAPGYAAPAAAAPAPAYSAPAASAPAAPAVIDADTAEIERLKARVRELEQGGSQSTDSWQVPAQGNYAAPAERNDAPGSSIDTWQAPSAAGAQGDTPYPSDWRPTYNTPGTGGWNNTAGSAERGAANYRPPSQYPGQQTYELGK